MLNVLSRKQQYSGQNLQRYYVRCIVSALSIHGEVDVNDNFYTSFHMDIPDPVSSCATDTSTETCHDKQDKGGPVST